jgi:hypothetical protein
MSTPSPRRTRHKARRHKARHHKARRRKARHHKGRYHKARHHKARHHKARRHKARRPCRCRFLQQCLHPYLHSRWPRKKPRTPLRALRPYRKRNKPTLLWRLCPRAGAKPWMIKAARSTSRRKSPGTPAAHTRQGACCPCGVRPVMEIAQRVRRAVCQNAQAGRAAGAGPQQAQA